MSEAASGFFPLNDGTGRFIEIRDVWASNVDEEMAKIRELLLTHNFVSMDTEFPGVVARPAADYSGDAAYQTLRCNVDLLKLIQLGLTFTDSEGGWADGCTCWQFNFKFSLTDDIFAQDSIELLKHSGIDFDKFEKYGIDIQYFGELMMMSGLVLTDDVKWISFHGSYDFAYLLKTLTCCDLPAEEQGFMELLYTFFPGCFDVKFIMTSVDGLHGGLAALGDTLEVERIGPMHQAGSDSLLTAQTFFALTRKHLGSGYDENRYRGQINGIGDNHTRRKSAYTSNVSLGSTQIHSGSISNSGHVSSIILNQNVMNYSGGQTAF